MILFRHCVDTKEFFIIDDKDIKKIIVRVTQLSNDARDKDNPLTENIKWFNVEDTKERLYKLKPMKIEESDQFEHIYQNNSIPVENN